MTTLDSLGCVHQTDKASWHHGYLDTYEAVFVSLHDEPITLLELGWGCGDSAKMWHEYFPNASIAFIDDRFNDFAFTEAWPRIHLHRGDQSDPAVISETIEAHPGGFDIVVDDCSHDAVKTVASFAMLWPHVKPGGFYAIEDVDVQPGLYERGMWKIYSDAEWVVFEPKLLVAQKAPVSAEVCIPGVGSRPGLRSLVGFPLYHQVPATWFAQWEKMDRQHVAGSVVVNGAYITTAMNVMVEMALGMDEPWDRLLVYEHDMIPPSDAITRIANYDPDYDIVGCMYFSHNPPHFPFVYIVDPEDGDTDPIAPDTVKDWCDDPMLYEVGAIGFGFTSIARHVLEKWDPAVPMFAMGESLGSHDLWFCKKARQQGFKVYVDSGIVCEHLSEIPVGLAQNQEFADQIKPENIYQFDHSGAS